MSDKIFTKCQNCGGDGIVQQWGLLNGVSFLWSEYSCTVCSGTGNLETGFNENLNLYSKIDALVENDKIILEYLEKILANMR